MLEKSSLCDDRIAACLGKAFGLQVGSIEFLPIGKDARSWAYRARAAAGITYFVKFRKGQVYEPSIGVPHFLRESGITQVIAPLPALDGKLWTELGGFTLTLYPFVEGKAGMDVGLSDEQWVEYGSVLRSIHSATLPATLQGQLRQERFTTRYYDMVRRLLAASAPGDHRDALEERLGLFLARRRAEIEAIVARAERLGRSLRHRQLPFVLCHSDIHTANIMLDTSGALHVVDWDEVSLAPKERDLMFVIGASGPALGYGSRGEVLFREGYGDTELDWTALAYYRYDWAVQDIGDYGEQVLFTPGTGDDNRNAAFEGLIWLFESGSTVDLAYQWDRTMPVDLSPSLA